MVDRDILEKRYDLSEKILKNSSKYETNLKSIYDLERILRRIKLHKLHPLELTYLATSLNSILTILKESKEDKINFDVKLMEGIEELKGYLYYRFNLGDVWPRFKIGSQDWIGYFFRGRVYIPGFWIIILEASKLEDSSLT